MKVLLVVYDNGSYIHWFPIGLGYIAAVLRNAGHEVTIYNQDVYHYPESHLTEYLTKNHFDVVGVSVIAGYYQYWKLLKISEAINAVPNKPFYIIGGHGPAPEPEYFLKKTKADAVCIGEGEVTAVELLEAIAGKRSFHSVKGIAFMENGQLVQTPRRELITDIDSIPLPAWDLFPMDYYTLLRGPHIKNEERSFTLLSGRGCIFQCNFCFRLDKGFRPRSAEAIIEQAKRDAKMMLEEAKKDLTDKIARREAQAVARIARAEAEAADEVRRAAADAATEAARRVMADQTGVDQFEAAAREIEKALSSPVPTSDPTKKPPDTRRLFSCPR